MALARAATAPALEPDDKRGSFRMISSGDRLTTMPSGLSKLRLCNWSRQFTTRACFGSRGESCGIVSFPSADDKEARSIGLALPLLLAPRLRFIVINSTTKLMQNPTQVHCTTHRLPPPHRLQLSHQHAHSLPKATGRSEGKPDEKQNNTKQPSSRCPRSQQSHLHLPILTVGFASLYNFAYIHTGNNRLASQKYGHTSSGMPSQASVPCVGPNLT